MGKVYTKIRYLTRLPRFMVRYKPVRTVNHGTWAALLHSLGKSNSSLCYIYVVGDTHTSLNRNPSTDVRKLGLKFTKSDFLSCSVFYHPAAVTCQFLALCW